MNGHYQDPTFATQDQQEPQTNGFQTGTATTSNGLAVTDPSRADESVDSAVSLPGSDVAEQNEKQTQQTGAVDPSSNEQPVHEPAQSSDLDTIAVARAASQQVPQQDGDLVGQNSIEVGEPAESNPVSQTSPVGHKSNVNSLPLYRPPAPLSQSPELSKRQPLLPNGVSAEPKSPENNKRKWESISEGSKASKRPKTAETEEQSGAAEQKDLEFAKFLQQNDLGLRQRSK